MGHERYTWLNKAMNDSFLVYMSEVGKIYYIISKAFIGLWWNSWNIKIGIDVEYYIYIYNNKDIYKYMYKMFTEIHL